VNWRELTIAVVGGDEREREIARLVAETGAEVRAFGFPCPAAGIPGVAVARTAAGALAGACYALFPVPGLGLDGSLYAPFAPEPIVPDEHLLAALRPGGDVLLGRADERLRAAASRLGIGIHEYEDDRELMLLRGPAIVEGALQVAIEHTDVTLHAAEVGIVGHGTIGALLARAAIALGAHVHVFARNPVQRAAAYAAGATPHSLEELVDRAPELDLVLSTVPAPVVGADVLSRLPTRAVVVDLAAPPGGVDFAAADELGRCAVWARGLGRRAPVTVGASQWRGIRRRIEAIEEAREQRVA
jgi:dipicolinate synthase subunit A